MSGEFRGRHSLDAAKFFEGTTVKPTSDLVVKWSRWFRSNYHGRGKLPAQTNNEVP